MRVAKIDNHIFFDDFRAADADAVDRAIDLVQEWFTQHGRVHPVIVVREATGLRIEQIDGLPPMNLPAIIEQLATEMTRTFRRLTSR